MAGQVPLGALSPWQADASMAKVAPNLLESDLRTREKEIIIEAVKNNASRKQAAEKLGISPRTLRYKMARFRKQEVGAAVPA
jgi:two-component system response regulator FlrC